MRKIKEAIIHCADFPWGNVQQIDGWHRQRGFSQIGYHFVILNGWIGLHCKLRSLDGAIQTGRPLELVGAHTKGHNRNSIDICLIGRDTFTNQQFQSLRELLHELEKKFPGLKMTPHRKYNKRKTCPNFTLEKVLNYEF